MQVALLLSLLISAGLFVRGLGKLYTLDAGFKKENVLPVSTDARMIGYQGEQVAALHQRLLEGFKTIPGVRSAAAVVPSSHDNSNPYNFHSPIGRMAIQWIRRST